MQFSVIVPVHNTSAYLRRCVQALSAQDYPRDEYEILMVDNNSTDSSGELLRAVENIRVFSESQPGSYCARNRGLREARGEIIAFTDSDCYPDKWWLRAAERALDDPSVQVVLGNRRPGRDTGLMRLIADYEVKKDAIVLSSEDPQLYYGFTNNMAVRRATMERHGPFVERPRGSDTIFIRRVVNTEGCAAVVFEPKMVIHHGEMESTRTYYRKMYTYGRSRQQYAHIMRTRSLSSVERWRIFLATIRDGRYSWLEAISLAAVLGLGVLAWHLGALSHRLSERLKS